MRGSKCLLFAVTTTLSRQRLTRADSLDFSKKEIMKTQNEQKNSQRDTSIPVGTRVPHVASAIANVRDATVSFKVAHDPIFTFL
jgi:hypothetical protein